MTSKAMPLPIACHAVYESALQDLCTTQPVQPNQEALGCDFLHL
jgi:hypothetical protein